MNTLTRLLLRMGTITARLMVINLIRVKKLVRCVAQSAFGLVSLFREI